MIKSVFIILLLLSNIGFSQVGINTATPDAQLDIRSSNQATPASNDGVLIPKIDDFPILNPTIAQQGMLVYLTTLRTFSSFTKPIGFYYWDFPTLNWIQIATAATTDSWSKTGNAGTNPATNFLGTTDNQPIVFRINNTERARIATNGYFGVGTTNPIFPITISGTIASLGIDRFGGTIPPQVVFRHANGTPSSPTATTSGQVLGRLASWSYNGTTYQQNASIDLIASGSQSINSVPSDILFSTSNIGTGVANEKMRLTFDGKLGLGTPTPVRELHIFKNSLNSVVLGITNLNNTVASNASTQLALDSYSSSGNLYTFGANSNGVKQYSPNSTLLENSGIVDISSLNLSSLRGKIRFYTNSGIERMLISETGDIGIGTSSPNANLHVAGTVAFTTATNGTANSIILQNGGTFATPLASATNSGVVYTIRNTSTSSILTVQNIINYGATIPADYGIGATSPAIQIVSDGTNWWRIQ